MALSTIEAEYIALTKAINESIWLYRITNIKEHVVKVHCGSQSAIHLSKNASFRERTKHIDVRLHFVGDIVSQG